jgi:hypothetical protein
MPRRSTKDTAAAVEPLVEKAAASDDRAIEDHINIEITDVVRSRFEAKYRKNVNGCWIWQKYKDKDGYGQFKFNGVAWRAHRFSYELYVGPIPEGMDLDHTCHIRRCVNPEHLEPVTHEDNMKNLRKPPDTYDDENDPAGWEQTTPQVVLTWAASVAKRSKLEPVVAIAGTAGFAMGTEAAAEAPWRDCPIEEGHVPKDPYSWIALFLATVSMGVNWKDAAQHLLKVTPFAVNKWRERNSDFKNDLMAAIQSGRRERHLELEERTMDTLERKLPGAPFKEVVRLLEVQRRREEMHLKPRGGAPNSGGALPGAGPTFNLIINTQPGKEIETLEKVADVMSAQYRIVPDVHELPPPDIDEDDEDEE